MAHLHYARIWITAVRSQRCAPWTKTQEQLDDLLRGFAELRERSIGYPCNLDFDYTPLLPFLSYSLNNVGDPFHESNLQSNTHEVEREVIHTFADLMRLPREQAWGYVTSGGTEGNMYGLYLAREMFPDGVVYFSQDTHYSAVKILRVLKVRNIMIKSQDTGEIDYDDLRETIRINRDAPRHLLGKHRHDHERRGGRRTQGAGDPGRPSRHESLHSCRRGSERDDFAVR